MGTGLKHFLLFCQLVLLFDGGLNVFCCFLVLSVDLIVWLVDLMSFCLGVAGTGLSLWSACQTTSFFSPSCHVPTLLTVTAHLKTRPLVLLVVALALIPSAAVSCGIPVVATILCMHVCMYAWMFFLLFPPKRPTRGV